jgi:ribonucleotide monophosphatase NagD (HAD superfamily)
MIDSCLKIIGVDASRALMVGDRLDTDILAGERAGTPTLLVLTGVSTVQEVVETGIVPTAIVKTLDPLTVALARRAVGTPGSR